MPHVRNCRARAVRPALRFPLPAVDSLPAAKRQSRASYCNPLAARSRFLGKFPLPSSRRSTSRHRSNSSAPCCGVQAATGQHGCQTDRPNGPSHRNFAGSLSATCRGLRGQPLRCESIATGILGARLQPCPRTAIYPWRFLRLISASTPCDVTKHQSRSESQHGAHQTGKGPPSTRRM